MLLFVGAEKSLFERLRDEYAATSKCQKEEQREKMTSFIVIHIPFLCLMSFSLSLS